MGTYTVWEGRAESGFIVGVEPKSMGSLKTVCRLKEWVCRLWVEPEAMMVIVGVEPEAMVD